VTTHAAISDDTQVSVRAYEALRHQVLASANTAGDGGVVLVLRQGVAGWMARRLVCADSPAPAATRTSTPLAGQEIGLGIVRVLASMALAAQPEVCI
jgi:hypothetical protein